MLRVLEPKTFKSDLPESASFLLIHKVGPAWGWGGGGGGAGGGKSGIVKDNRDTSTVLTSV